MFTSIEQTCEANSDTTRAKSRHEYCTNLSDQITASMSRDWRTGQVAMRNNRSSTARHGRCTNDWPSIWDNILQQVIKIILSKYIFNKMYHMFYENWKLVRIHLGKSWTGRSILRWTTETRSSFHFGWLILTSHVKGFLQVAQIRHSWSKTYMVTAQGI